MKKIREIIWLLEMGSSWNFSARASPSCEDSEPSRAELGHFNFRAETELDYFLMYSFSSSKYVFFFCFCQFLNQKISHFKKKKYHVLQLELKIEKFSENPRKIRKKTQFFNFRAEIFFPSWKKKATSRAELKILQLELGSDSSLILTT